EPGEEKMIPYPPVVIQVLLALIVIPAALFDSRQRRVPNWLALTGVLLGIGLNSFLYETPGLWFSLKGLGLAFAVYFPLYLIRGMGAGDVKLMAAVGAISGWADWVGIFMLTSVLGGLAAVVLVLAKGRVQRTLANIGLILASLRHRQAPYQGNP